MSKEKTAGGTDLCCCCSVSVCAWCERMFVCVQRVGIRRLGFGCAKFGCFLRKYTGTSRDYLGTLKVIHERGDGGWTRCLAV